MVYELRKQVSEYFQEWPGHNCMSKLWRINKTLSKRLLFNLGMADTGINKKLQTGIITITAILTYLLCESGIINGVVPSV